MLNEEQYHVYTVRSMFGHEIVAMTTDHKSYVAVEWKGRLNFGEFNAEELMTERKKSFFGVCAKSLVFQGFAVTSMAKLQEKSLVAFNQFGKYNIYYNNCQDFCTLFLKNIGLCRQNITSMKKLVLYYSFTFILAIVFDKRRSLANSMTSKL